jgi:hypothetical protein
VSVCLTNLHASSVLAVNMRRKGVEAGWRGEKRRLPLYMLSMLSHDVLAGWLAVRQ